MAESTGAESLPLLREVRPGAVVLLVLTIALAVPVVTISYGLAREYGDTAATDARNAAQSLRDWGIGIVLVIGFAGWVFAAARRSRGRRVMTVTATIAAVTTLVGVPAGAVLGVRQKFHAYPDLPSCTDGFRTGPAVPVVRAAQAGLAELDHPGPFSGGGSSGVDGCSTQLMVHEDVDVPAVYRGTLTDTGWRISHDDADLVAARKNGQEFEASRSQDGSWWVWVGPAGLQPQPDPARRSGAAPLSLRSCQQGSWRYEPWSRVVCEVEGSRPSDQRARASTSRVREGSARCSPMSFGQPDTSSAAQSAHPATRR